jgi:hypothetical protein
LGESIRGVSKKWIIGVSILSSKKTKLLEVPVSEKKKIKGEESVMFRDGCCIE